MSDSVRPIEDSPPSFPSLGFSRQEHWSALPFPSPMHESEKWKWNRSVVSDSSNPMDSNPLSMGFSRQKYWSGVPLMVFTPSFLLPWHMARGREQNYKGRSRRRSKDFSVQSLSCVQLCDSMNCSTPGLAVHHQLPEFTQTQVHRDI